MTMDLIQRSQLYQEALIKWGFELQCMTLAEECLELAAELIRFTHRPWRSDPKDLAKEVADVSIMLEQIDIAMFQEHDKDWPSRVLAARELALRDLRDKLLEATEE